MKAHRSAPGGSGAGGSVVIITKSLHGNPNSKIQVDGGIPVDCAFGTGGGKLNPLPSPPITNAFSSTFSCVFMRSKTSVESSYVSSIELSHTAFLPDKLTDCLID